MSPGKVAENFFSSVSTLWVSDARSEDSLFSSGGSIDWLSAEDGSVVEAMIWTGEGATGAVLIQIQRKLDDREYVV